MFHIAICDDEIEELDKAEHILEIYRKQHKTCDFSVQRFTDAEEMLQKIQKKEYVPDLLFMDIYLPDRLGIDVVKELRGMGNGCRIIFATTSTEYALEAFRVNADQYFVKPIMEKELFPVLDKLFEKVGISIFVEGGGDASANDKPVALFQNLFKLFHKFIYVLFGN